LVVLALAGFAALALIGLWDRYSQETAALGFSDIYERHLARSNFPDDPKAYRAATEVDRRQQAGNVVRETTALEE
jgi:hypothetical protein